MIFGGDEIPEAAARLVRDAPPELGPMEVIRLALDEVATVRFAGRRQETATWRRMIDADDSLRDRDARKRADLVAAVRTAFIGRGESELSASIFAETGALVFHVALEAWLAEPEPRPMTDTIDDVMSSFSVRRPAGGSEPPVRSSGRH